MFERKIFKNEKGLSNIALGCDHYGENITKESAYDFLDYYFSSNGCILDTARSYSDGKSEKIVGDYLRQNNNRMEVFLITKGGFPSKLGQSRLNIFDLKQDFSKSCDALNTIPNLWFLHRDDPNIPSSEIVDMACEVVKNTNCKIGVSNWEGQRIGNDRRISASQIQFSLAESTPKKHGDNTIVCMNKKEYLYYQNHNIPVFCFSSLSKGYYSKLFNHKVLSDKIKIRFDSEKNKAKLTAIEKIALKYNVPISSVAVSWLYSQKNITLIPICSGSSIKQFEESFENINLTDEDYKLLPVLSSLSR